MLTEKDKKKITLTPITKTNARVIPLKKPAADDNGGEPEERKLLPPLTPFNTAYRKGRDNDPL